MHVMYRKDDFGLRTVPNGFDKKVHEIVETRTLSFVLEVSLFHSIICIGVQCSLTSSNMIAALQEEE